MEGGNAPSEKYLQKQMSLPYERGGLYISSKEFSKFYFIKGAGGTLPRKSIQLLDLYIFDSLGIFLDNYGLRLSLFFFTENNLKSS